MISPILRQVAAHFRFPSRSFRARAECLAREIDEVNSGQRLAYGFATRCVVARRKLRYLNAAVDLADLRSPQAIVSKTWRKSFSFRSGFPRVRLRERASCRGRASNELPMSRPALRPIRHCGLPR